MSKNVVIGLSGGIDSSVAALLLKKQGYNILGVTFKLWEESGKFNAENYIDQASNFAYKNNIKHIIIDLRKDFNKLIVHHFISEYISGRTPLICSYCNKIIKLNFLQKTASEYNYKKIVTGHYVNTIKINNKSYIKKGKDKIKDQSYFLWELKENTINKMITPIGNYTKNEVRQLAKEFGLKDLFNKKESMGVCFLQNNDYREFIKNNAKDLLNKIKHGKIYDKNNNLIGTHKGLAYYTIGQKRDLNLITKENYYVNKLIPENNSIIVATKRDLNTKIIFVDHLSFIDINDLLKYNGKIKIKIRGYGLNPEKECYIEFVSKNKLKVILQDNAWAPASGQPVVFYYKNILLGGGLTV